MISRQFCQFLVAVFSQLFTPCIYSYKLWAEAILNTARSHWAHDWFPMVLSEIRMGPEGLGKLKFWVVPLVVLRMRFPLVNKMHCHRKQDVEQGLPKCARRWGAIPFKRTANASHLAQNWMLQFCALKVTLLHEKWVKMVRHPGDLNAPESNIFYGIRIQGNVDIAGQSKTRPKSIWTLRRISQCTGAIRFRLSQQKIRLSRKSKKF